jgi:phosphoribosylamine--glycine ligase
VLPLIKSDFLDLLTASPEGNIGNYSPEFYDGNYCCVVLASKGYPDKYETGKELTGLDNITEDCLIFHSGTKSDGMKILSAGGRVLNVVGKSDTDLKSAIDTAYKNAEIINFENKYYRKDIAIKGL